MQECFTIVQIDLTVDTALVVEVGSDSRLFLLSFFPLLSGIGNMNYFL